MSEVEEAFCAHPTVIPVVVGAGVMWLCKDNTCKQRFVPMSDEVVLAIKYEHTFGYLPKDDAKDINDVTDMLNRFGEDGWMFTGWAKEVLNGTFYMFVRPKE